jgi:hypothetical protein
MGMTAAFTFLLQLVEKRDFEQAVQKCPDVRLAAQRDRWAFFNSLLQQSLRATSSLLNPP